ncbi:hypothetical protein [Rhodococcus sp. RS1C4]|nr:hypothetical protein [Rhodococcus sp. RS1C4]
MNDDTDILAGMTNDELHQAARIARQLKDPENEAFFTDELIRRTLA